MKNERLEELESSFIKTLTSSQLSDVMQDVSEIGLDSLLSDSVLKELPIISTVVAIGKTAVAVRDYFLLKKILLLLEGMDGTSPEERETFIRKVEAKPKYEQSVGETIMILLERYDHLDKASLMSKVLCACIKGEITYDTFIRISTAIDRAFIVDLKEILDYYASEETDSELRYRRNRISRNVYSSNLSDFYVLTEEQANASGYEHLQVYSFNRYAEAFAKAVLGSRFRKGRR